MKTGKRSIFTIHRVARSLVLLSILGGLLLLGMLPGRGLAAALPTRTPTRIPSRTPTPRSADFMAGKANKTVPGDVLAELFWGGFKGGGPGDVTNPCTVSAAKAPYLAGGNLAGSQELFTTIWMDTCGWKDSEKVEIQIEYPDGRVVSEQSTAAIFYDWPQASVAYELVTAWDDPTGPYRVRFHGSSGEVVATLNMIRPAAPRVVVLDASHVLLHHFSPNEKIRVLSYHWCQAVAGHCLLGWQAYQVDGDGNLLLKLVDPGDMLYFLGERSGELESGFISPSDEGSFKMVKRTRADSRILQSSCPGAPPQRLKTRFEAQVCTKSDNVRVRQQPKTSANVVTKLKTGTHLLVLAGPVCADNSSWWQVASSIADDKPLGWISEGGDKTDPYLLCPGN